MGECIVKVLSPIMHKCTLLYYFTISIEKDIEIVKRIFYNNFKRNHQIIIIFYYGVNIMQNESIEKAIENAAASVEMEGFHIDEQSKVWCRQLLLKEITMEEYIRRVKQKAGL